MLVLVADLFAFGVPLDRSQSAARFLASDPVIAKLQAIAADLEQHGDRLRLMRYVPKRAAEIDVLTDLVLNPNMGTHFGLEDSSGYITQVLMRYGRLFESFEAGTTSPVQVRPFLDAASLTSHLPAIAALNVLLTTRPLGAALLPHFEQLFADRGYFVYRCKEALPRASVFGRARLFPAASKHAEAWSSSTREQELLVLRSAGFDPHAELVLEGAPELAPQDGALPRATITRYAPEQVEIALAPGRAAYLYLADAYCPGWEALVDGVPSEVYPANVAFRGVLLPAGAKRVVLRYRPLDFSVGSGLSIAGVLAWALALWRARAHGTRA
ncbi:MAG: YfhO family protein [Planctomycetota bacterium]